MRRLFSGASLLVLLLVAALAATVPSTAREIGTPLAAGGAAQSSPAQAPAAQSPAAQPPAAAAPADPSALHFAVIGDMGTGEDRQRDTGAMMARVRARVPFEFVITTGDNMYGGTTTRDYNRKFEIPYRQLLDAKVLFYASLGNHDPPSQRFYKLYNMDGERYYTFKKGPARFFALDSPYMTPDQIAWFDKELERSDERWKIAYMHHPMYSSGRRHGPELELRRVLEPLLIKHHVQVVFAGHEHFYERYAPQSGVQHFISGAGGQLRTLNIKRTKDTAAGFDTDNSFMVVTIRGDEMYFESISRLGRVVDAGVVSQAGGTRAVPLPTYQQD